MPRGYPGMENDFAIPDSLEVAYVVHRGQNGSVARTWHVIVPPAGTRDQAEKNLCRMLKIERLEQGGVLNDLLIGLEKMGYRQQSEVVDVYIQIPDGNLTVLVAKNGRIRLS